MDTVLRGRTTTVTIGAGQPFCIIDERINPTGRKKLAEELKGGDLSTVVADTESQVAAGADRHFLVIKREQAGRTVTAVEPLAGETRVMEMARMLGGAQVTERSLAHARELIGVPAQE